MVALGDVQDAAVLGICEKICDGRYTADAARKLRNFALWWAGAGKRAWVDRTGRRAYMSMGGSMPGHVCGAAGTVMRNTETVSGWSQLTCR